jgi:hypothetical protein
MVNTVKLHELLFNVRIMSVFILPSSAPRHRPNCAIDLSERSPISLVATTPVEDTIARFTAAVTK